MEAPAREGPVSRKSILRFVWGDEDEGMDLVEDGDVVGCVVSGCESGFMGACVAAATDAETMIVMRQRATINRGEGIIYKMN